MIRSMTAYSRMRSDDGTLALSVSVKSTNHRFLDLQVRLPAGLESCEAPVRRLVKEHMARGHVEVQVNLERVGAGEFHLDRKMLDAYLGAWRKVREELGVGSELDLVALLRIPGMMAAGNAEIPADELEKIQTELLRVAGETLDRLNEMRAREGEALERDLQTRLERLATMCHDIGELAREAPRLYGRRLEKRVGELLANVGLDPGRLAQEAAFLASRSDVEEELTRFRSHLDQAQLLVKESSEVGKKLDFILQEMNREANTLLSKTTDVPEIGLEMTRQAIEMKTEIEKLREQAQNVE
ncbi:MAG: YicC family protein [Acidobacteria bacterium]|nr:YicC family protein [Acidobacteriota bacterium]MBI1982956.1 YicC family protein [Acidobacteriota bacterium]